MLWGENILKMTSQIVVINLLLFLERMLLSWKKLVVVIPGPTLRLVLIR